MQVLAKNRVDLGIPNLTLVSARVARGNHLPDRRGSGCVRAGHGGLSGRTRYSVELEREALPLG